MEKRPEAIDDGGGGIAPMSKVTAWFTSLHKGDNEIVELTNQFYITLRAYFARIQCNGRPPCQASFDRIAQLLDPNRPHEWNDCYEVEQLMVNLFDDAMLQRELEFRTLEARNLRPALADHYVKAASDAKTSDERRTLLTRLINDLQWRYTVNEGKRRFSKSLTSRTGTIFLLALGAYAILIGSLLLFRPAFQPRDLRLFYIAGLAGTWGATFSMLTSLKSRIDASGIYDLKLMRAWVMLLSRALIGAGAAGILYFFLLSGLLSGSAFPTLDPSKVTDPDGLLHAGQLALLVVWCFLAGFSEKLVPDLLARTEARADTSAAVPPERFRPTGANGRPSPSQVPAAPKPLDAGAGPAAAAGPAGGA